MERQSTDACREAIDSFGLSPSAVQRRLSRYRSSGVIAKQVAVLDPDVVAGTVLACVLVTLERESKREPIKRGLNIPLRQAPRRSR